MNPKKVAFVAGASGEIGKRLVQNLIAHNQIKEIHLLVRSKLELNHPCIHQHLVDFADLSRLSIENTSDNEIISFCTLGTTIKKAGSKVNFSQVDLTYVENFAKWAQKNNCKRLAVVSSIDANADSKNFYLKTKGSMEASLKSLAWNALWIVRPSLLTGKRNEFRIGEALGALAAKFITPLLLGPYKKYRPIHMQTVADALSNFIDSDQDGTHIIESDEIGMIATYHE